jgi:hypothetical protein
LPVRGRSASTDYSREAFGTAWKDVDRNGCDTRNDILQRDFNTAIFKPGTGDCKVIGGTWIDPYSNESYTFSEPPSGAQIDHVVSLKNAWQMGADQWDDQTRTEFANDPLNLRVTIASLNHKRAIQMQLHGYLLTNRADALSSPRRLLSRQNGSYLSQRLKRKCSLLS